MEGRLMQEGGFVFANLWPLAVTLAAALILCAFLLKRLKSE